MDSLEVNLFQIDVVLRNKDEYHAHFLVDYAEIFDG